MVVDYFVLDIETLPIDVEAAQEKDEEEREELINPVDSKVIAVGILTSQDQYYVYDKDDEERLLKAFWKTWSKLNGSQPGVDVVGFHHKQFDLPFLVTRSYKHGQPVQPYNKADLLDVREKLTGHQYGKSRGTLKDYAEMIGVDTPEMNGSHVLDAYAEGRHDDIRDYLKEDLRVTKRVYERVCELNIDDITKY